MNHKSLSELAGCLGDIRSSPADHGTLELIVIRPVTDARHVLEDARVSAAGGLHGDKWAVGCWKKLPDGSPDPEVQIVLMNSRCIAAIAGAKENWPPAGDSLFVDLDLSEANLKTGDRLSIGTAIIEITAVPHNGCQKFRARYGDDALKFVNGPEFKHLKLRGVYARVVQDGTVRTGGRIRKIAAASR